MGQSIQNGIIIERIHHASERDSLTGLPRADHLMTLLQSRCQEDAPAFSLLCINVDDFKVINDIFGHDMGDQLLHKISTLVQTMLGEQGELVRSRGDEFLLLFDHSESSEAKKFAQKIERTLTRFDTGLVHPKLGKLRLPLSIGIAHFPQDGNAPSELLSCATHRVQDIKNDRKLTLLSSLSSPSPSIRGPATRKSAVKKTA